MNSLEILFAPNLVINIYDRVNGWSYAVTYNGLPYTGAAAKGRKDAETKIQNDLLALGISNDSVTRLIELVDNRGRQQELMGFGGTVTIKCYISAALKPKAAPKYATPTAVVSRA